MRSFAIITTVIVAMCLPVLVRLIKKELRVLNRDVNTLDVGAPPAKAFKFKK